MTLRETLAAELAGIEADVQRARIEFAGGVDLLITATRVERAGDGLHKLADRMLHISSESLKQTLDEAIEETEEEE